MPFEGSDRTRATHCKRLNRPTSQKNGEPRAELADSASRPRGRVGLERALPSSPLKARRPIVTPVVAHQAAHQAVAGQAAGRQTAAHSRPSARASADAGSQTADETARLSAIAPAS